MRLCERAGNDLVRDLFCGAAAPEITSLIDLQTALAIDASHIGGMTGLSVTSDSTALSARSVSAINLRVIAVRVDVPPVELLALAYTRGEQFSELVVRDRADGELRFY